MKKNGFTLVELLGVFVIIGILAFIAIPAVMSCMGSFKNTYYTSLEKNVSLSGNDYFLEHRNQLPKDIDMTSIIEISKLVSNGYKDEKEGICDGYVLAIKKNTKEYEYITCLSCANGYHTESLYCTEEYLSGNNYILKVPRDYQHEMRMRNVKKIHVKQR